MTPYEEGKEAVLSGEEEPECKYTPGTDAYREFAEGFCHRIDETIKGLPDWYE